MHRIIKRYIAFILAFTLVATNFSGNFASARVYAVADEEDLEEQVNSSDDESIFESLTDLGDTEEDEEPENSDESQKVEENTVENQNEEITGSEDEVDEATAGSDLIDSEISDEEKNKGSEVQINEAETSIESASLGNTVMDSAEEKASSSDSASVVYEKKISESIAAATLTSKIEASASSNAASLASTDAAALASSDAASLASTDAAALSSTEEEEPEEVRDSTVVNGIKITLFAKPGALPNDAVLEVNTVETALEENIEEAIDKDTGAKIEVERTISFDINIYSESEGGYVQPDDSVRITFEEVYEDTGEDVSLSVYHVKESGDEVRALDEIQSEKEDSDLVIETDHFSIYTIAFLRENDAKAAKFRIIPYDENGEEIHITSYGETIVSIDSNVEKEPKDVALNLAGYTFKRATVEKRDSWPWYYPEVTKIIVDADNLLLTVQSKYGTEVFNDTYNWINKDTNRWSLGPDCPDIRFEYESDAAFAEDELVYFYVLYSGADLPTDSAGKSSEDYYPSGGSHGDTNEKWLGRAVPLYEIDVDERDKVNVGKYGFKAKDWDDEGGNLWDIVLDSNNNVLPSSGNKVRQYIRSVPKDKINAYFASQEAFDCFTEDDISWYVYKRQEDALHIDGFINTSVKYHSNYTGGPASIEDKLRYMTNHTVRGEDTFTREGYIFKGWSLTAGEGNTPDSNYDPTKTITVGKKLNLYAVWEKDPVLEAAISVELNPGVWFYDGKEHTNNTDYTVDYGTTTGYVVKSITTDGAVKNMIEPTTANNHITSVTIEDTIKHKTYVLKVNKDNTCETKDGGPSKVTVKHSTLTVKPRTVTLTSEPLKKAFDGTYLTADERFAAGETNARKITATPFDEKNGTGFVSGEGIDEAKTKFTGKRLGVGTTPEGNTFDYMLKDGTTEYTKEHVGNYIIDTKCGDLTITPPDEKFKIKIALKAQADGTGRDTTVIYDGVIQEANMDVHVTVSGDVEDTSILRKIIDALKNGTQKLFNAGVLVAHAEDRKPGEALKVEKQTVTIEGIDITVDNLYVHGGAGIDTGDYPIILDYSKMTIDTTVDGEKIDLTKVVELEIDTIKGETQKYGVNPDLKTDEEIIGWLHVLPREVTLLSDTASKKYDGIPLTAKHVSETAYVKGTNKGFVPGEGVDYDITGSLLGSPEVEQNSVNTYNYVLKSNTKAINYKITPEYGKLTVTPLEGEDNPPEPTPDPPTPTPTPTPDDPSSDDPTPDNPTPDTPTTVTYIPPVVTTAVAPAPVAAVLGARREAPTNGAAVLGARRSKTSDETNDGARALVIAIAAGAALSVLITRKKKNEEESNS